MQNQHLVTAHGRGSLHWYIVFGKWHERVMRSEHVHDKHNTSPLGRKLRLHVRYAADQKIVELYPGAVTYSWSAG